MACDDIALLSTKQEGKEYAATVLRVAESFSGYVPAGAGLLGLLEVSDNLLHRVRSVADSTRARRAGWGASLLVLMVALFLPMGVWPAMTPGGTPNTPASPGPVAQSTAPATAVTTATAPANAERPGVALIEFSRVGAQDGLGEVAAKLQELVGERLANRPEVRLVDRDRIEKAMAEVKLSATGLVDAATASQIGKIVGARTLIAGRVMKSGDQWVVTARLIDAQTSEIRATRTEGAETDGVVKLADAVAAAIAARLQNGTAQPASSGVSELDAAVARLRERLAGRSLPRVVVVIPESHLGTWVPDPAGENEVIRVLTQVGFPVVDVDTLMKRESGEWWANLFFGPAQHRPGTEATFRQGGRSASDLLHDARIDRLKSNTDILVTGEAFSEYAGENYGFKSCRARVELKAIDTGQEQIAVATSSHATGADIAEMVAGKAALRTAGGQAGLELATELAAYWEKRAAAAPQKGS